MTCKTPQFWYRDAQDKPPLSERVLSFFSPLYGFGHRLNQNRKTLQNIPIPVLCVGNVTAGGSGKTPVALALMDLIKKHDIAACPYFLSRGYGGKHKTPTRVDTRHHEYKDVGDEALLLTDIAPVIVSRDRYKGACEIFDYGADLIIMDDGLQNKTLHKDFSVLVINGEMGFGNQKLLPAGPLREPIDDSLEKVDAVIIIGEDQRNAAQLIPKSIPILEAHIQTREKQKLSSNAIAFAGLGYPQKFFNFLRHTYDLNNLEEHAFPDHHPYTDKDLTPLIEKAQKDNLSLITTRKDYIRVPEHLRPHIIVHDIEVVFKDTKTVVKMLEKLKAIS